MTWTLLVFIQHSGVFGGGAAAMHHVGGFATKEAAESAGRGLRAQIDPEHIHTNIEWAVFERPEGAQ